MERVKLKEKDLVVVKVGTSTLVHSDGTLNTEGIQSLVNQMAGVKKLGMDVLFVSSGAIGLGKGILDLGSKITMPQKQAAAAVGQVALMDAYTRLFEEHDLKVGQMLLINDDFIVKERAFNAKNTFEALRALNVITVVNENDSISFAEIKIGDNDNLSALVSIMLDASLLILLSDIDGLYSGNPSKDPNAIKYEVIDKIDEDLMKVASGVGSSLGTGGMATKLEAAFKVTNSGIPMVIANGSEEDIILNIVKDNFNGTYFKANETKKTLKKKWLGFFANTSGSVFIDDGAKDALCNKDKSLLVPGITSFIGEFNKGDIIAVYDQDHLLLAKGVAMLDNKELNEATSGVFLHKDNISLIEE